MSLWTVILTALFGGTLLPFINALLALFAGTG
jgi:hypothetical protein